jgi:hypothetical protein
MHITTPKAMNDYKNSIIDAYKKENKEVNYNSIYNEINNIMYSDYIKATEINVKNNERKTQHYRHLLISNVISAIFLILALFISLIF